jgi:hypothetical protein
MDVFGVWAPKPGTESECTVVAASVVVGAASPDEDGLLDCHFEGAVYGQENLGRFRERVSCAAGRRLHRYPTVARSAFPGDEMLKVALWDPVRDVFLSIIDASALLAWTGETAAQVVGPRLPPGPARWAEASRLAEDGAGARPIGRQDPNGTLWFRTAAGQVARFDLPAREAEVIDHDDPRLLRMLAPLRLDAAALKIIIGNDSRIS